jgi:Flp pilus assembly protein TadD
MGRHNRPVNFAHEIFRVAGVVAVMALAGGGAEVRAQDLRLAPSCAGVVGADTEVGDTLQSAPAEVLPEAPRKLAGPTPACLLRQGFVVARFENPGRVSSLRHLEAGLPALLAERLAQQMPLRYVGDPALLRAGSPRGDARFVLRGLFHKLPNMAVAITVEVASARTPEVVMGSARVDAHRNDLVGASLRAALEALGKVPGLDLAATPENLTAPFGRDPYAFVLYGRGVAAYLGIGGPRSAERAREHLGRALVIDPKIPEARRYLGLLHLEAGNPGHARTMWSYALDVRPDYTEAVEALAALERTSGVPAALMRYQRLLELDPDNLAAWRTYGELLYEAGRLEDAERALELVLSVEPADARARRTLTLVLASRQAGPELVREFEAIVELEPGNLEARIDLAAAYLAEGRVARATDTYEAVLNERPRDTTALKLAADLWRRQGHPEKAVPYYQKLRRLAPGDPRPAFLLGSAYHAAGDLAAAEKAFTEASYFPGMRPEAFSNLGAVLLKQSRAREARWFLMKASQARPDNPSVRFNHALALRDLGRNADALGELRAAQKVAPDDSEVRFLAGVVCLRLGKLSEAQLDFEAAVTLDPEHEAARHNLALLDEALGTKREGRGPAAWPVKSDGS